MNWTKTSDQLPEVHDLYIVWHARYDIPFVASWYKSLGYWYDLEDQCEVAPEDITHWAPLPTTPPSN